MRLSSVLPLITLIFSLAACSSLERKSAVPAQEMGAAQIAGLSGIRYMIQYFAMYIPRLDRKIFLLSADLLLEF